MSDGMASGGRDAGAVTRAPFVMGEEPGAIVAGFDVHRRQITIDALDTASGEVSRGQIESTPAAVEEWVAGFPGRVVHVAVEACTGWLFVSRALERCSAIVHLAEPVETSALRGRKRRQDRSRRRQVAAAAVVGGPAAGGLVAARACAPVALARPAAQHAGR